jgi:hypothetical protein
MITSGLGKEFVIGHTLSEARLAGERGIHACAWKMLACAGVSFIVGAALADRLGGLLPPMTSPTRKKL